MERLQKIIANSGYCSRRKAEELILNGKAKVNGETINTVEESSETITPATTEIIIKGGQKGSYVGTGTVVPTKGE